MSEYCTASIQSSSSNKLLFIWWKNTLSVGLILSAIGYFMFGLVLSYKGSLNIACLNYSFALSY